MNASSPSANASARAIAMAPVAGGFQVVDGFRKLVEIGLDKAAVSWIDYDEGIRQYHEVLWPLLRAAGLRG